MFYKIQEIGFKPIINGIKIKILVYGEIMMLSEFHME
jgi:hypothetical protein